MDAEQAQQAAERMLKDQFTLEDFLTQLREMRKLGPIQDLLKMLPGVPGGKNAMKEMAEAIDEGELARAEAIILSHDRRGAAESRYHLRVASPADRERIRGRRPPTSTRS